MTTNPTVTIVGNLTRDPELRFTPNGTPVASFSVAVNRRHRTAEGWEDAPAEFFNCSAWRGLAENLAETVAKGDRIIVSGRLQQRTWETDQGERRSTVEVVADAAGPELAWATAEVTRVRRRGPDQPPHPADEGQGETTPPAPGDDDEPF